jgi:superoxide dismutase, Cu-Zn family
MNGASGSGPSSTPTMSPSGSGAASSSSSATASANSSSSPSVNGLTGMLVTLQITQLPPGTHAVHIDSAGRCDPPDFMSSGPIFNPQQKQHGVKNPNGPEAGDLPNLTVGHDGTVTAAFLTSGITLQRGSPNSLFQASGTSLVIDTDPDDDMS